MTIVRFFTLVLLTLGPGALCAQQTQTVTDGRTQARIVAENGLINFYHGSERLSFDLKSFLTVSIGSTLYTNNDQPPAGTTYLPMDVQTRQGDTVTNTWILDGATFMQRVFPKMTKNGSKIAVQFLASKSVSTNVNIGCQYLLDLSLGGKDGSPVMYRDDYLASNSKKYSGEIPSYFVVVENGLPNPPSYDPGEIAMAILSDELNPSVEPSLVIAGHWPDLERMPYLTKDYVVRPTAPDMDRSILSQWPERALTRDSMQVIGEFAYGAADYFTCNGWLFALIFAPNKLWESQLQQDRTLDLPVYVFDPDPIKEYKTTITVDLEGALRLKGMEQYSNLTTYLPNSYKHFSLPVILDTTSNRLSGRLTITSAPTVFIDSCASTIMLVRDLVDDITPTIRVVSRNDSSDCGNRRDTIDVKDEGAGLGSIELVLNGYNARYLTDGSFPSSNELIELEVKDTLLRNTSATIRAIDQAGNVTVREVAYCPVADIQPPRFYIMYNGKDAWDILVTETRPWDQLLSHVGQTNSFNAEFSELTNSFKQDSTWLNVRILDPSRFSSICINAWDLANNKADTCLTMNPSLNVQQESSEEISLTPNPAADVVLINGPVLGEVRIVNTLGTVVKRIASLTDRTISVRDLPAGRYFLCFRSTIIPFAIER